MKIGLIDVDSHNYPNLCLMKISAFYKANGAEVEFVKQGGDLLKSICKQGIYREQRTRHSVYSGRNSPRRKWVRS